MEKKANKQRRYLFANDINIDIFLDKVNMLVRIFIDDLILNVMVTASFACSIYVKLLNYLCKHKSNHNYFFSFLSISLVKWNIDFKIIIDNLIWKKGHLDNLWDNDNEYYGLRTISHKQAKTIEHFELLSCPTITNAFISNKHTHSHTHAQLINRSLIYS